MKIITWTLTIVFLLSGCQKAKNEESKLSDFDACGLSREARSFYSFRDKCLRTIRNPSTLLVNSCYDQYLATFDKVSHSCQNYYKKDVVNTSFKSSTSYIKFQILLNDTQNN